MAMPNVTYPINTYGGLKQAVALWMDRDDDEFVNQIPNFINMAEKEIYRTLRHPIMEKEAYLQIISGQANIPTDWLETEYILRCKDGVSMRSTSIEEISGLKNGNLSLMDGETVWARYGKRFFFFPEINANLPTVDQTTGTTTMDGTEVIIGYYADQPELMADDDTDALLTISPEYLLYTTLKHASVFVQDDEAENRWSSKAQSVRDELDTQKADEEYSGSPLVLFGSASTGSGSSVYRYF